MLTIGLKNSGVFQVQANDPVGVEVVNETNSPIIVRITATGKWNVNTTIPLDDCDADGLPQEQAGTDKGFKMPQSKAGSLLIYRQKPNYYQRIGTLGDIYLYPQEIVAFVCNDGNYQDNRGSLDIKWELVQPDSVNTQMQFFSHQNKPPVTGRPRDRKPAGTH
ncbi:MAG: hypothetical protein F6K14_16465 [Symploca sp. SIO2C1]|nr:hypothetical protein [Symploca sp. SIO2C1]